MEGVNTVLLISSGDQGDRMQEHKNVIDTAKKMRVSSIAYTSRSLRDRTTLTNKLMEEHFATEDYIIQSGLKYIIFRNTLYMDVLPHYIGKNAFEEAGFVQVAGDGRVAFTLRKDQSEAMANVLLNETFNNQVYQFTGSEAYSLYDVANALTELSEKKITYTPVEVPVYKEMMKQQGLPEAVVNKIVNFNVDIKNGQESQVANDLEVELGRKPATLIEGLKSYLNYKIRQGAMPSLAIKHIKTIAEFHRYMELPKPEHPLISVVRFEEMKRRSDNGSKSIIHNFYSLALKKNFQAKMIYGQQDFDFDEGVMHFMSPKQVLSIQAATGEKLNHTGWLLLIHPDFLWNYPLAKKIKQYEYFSYKVNEALHLSEKEEILVTNIIHNISREYYTNIDNFSQDVIIAQIEVLLTYCERFYQRQFITRKIANHRVLNALEVLLTEYFKSDNLVNNGIPTVQFIAEHLHLSANYLSRLLQILTGQSTKQFIHDKLIDLAKEKLSTTDLSINEIAYYLIFEHPQSFSKLFKSRTNVSPTEFRQSFN